MAISIHDVYLENESHYQPDSYQEKRSKMKWQKKNCEEKGLSIYTSGPSDLEDAIEIIMRNMFWNEQDCDLDEVSECLLFMCEKLKLKSLINEYEWYRSNEITKDFLITIEH